MTATVYSLLSSLSLSAPFSGDLRVLLREFDATLALLAPWILSAYYGALFVLSLYAFHRLYLVFLLRRSERHRTASSHFGGKRTTLPPPRITVQLPIYNERSVVGRLIDAVAHLEYPKDLLEIQVLDDSTDETSAVAAERVAHWQQRGLVVRHLRRTERVGYKAGALAAGLEVAKGELIAIFDADFVPQPNFLRRMTPLFEDPSIGMVQARWDHLNRTSSILTRVQAMLLDGHFLIEHAARFQSNRLFNFNGTAGVWRRQAIEDGGGWQHDTLTEDLDLSYRSQLAGWRFSFLSDVGVAAELPESLAAYRGQQRRWARGSAQTLRKLAGSILRGPLTLGQRFEAIAHLSANLGYPLTVLVALLLPLVVYLRHLGAQPGLLALDLAMLFGGTLSLCAFYLEAVRRRGNNLLLGLLLMAPLLALCMGIAWHNAKAALGGLFVVGGKFERTPKSGTQTLEPAQVSPGSREPRPTNGWLERYRADRCFPWAETLIALYLGCATMLLAASGATVGLPFLLLFMCGFGSAAATLWRRDKPSRAALAPPDSAVIVGPEQTQ